MNELQARTLEAIINYLREMGAYEVDVDTSQRIPLGDIRVVLDFLLKPKEKEP